MPELIDGGREGWVRRVLYPRHLYVSKELASLYSATSSGTTYSHHLSRVRKNIGWLTTLTPHLASMYGSPIPLLNASFLARHAAHTTGREDPSVTHSHRYQRPTRGAARQTAVVHLAPTYAPYWVGTLIFARTDSPPPPRKSDPIL